MNDEDRRKIVREADIDEIVTIIKILIVCTIIPLILFACLFVLALRYI